MSFFQRLGTDRHKFKLEFVMRKLKFSRHLPGKIYLSIRRGDHKMKTEHLVQMDANHECDLKKQVAVFPSITLFYDKSVEKYQPKPGDIKILLLNDAGDKKLLGSVPFDVAEFANEKIGAGFNSNQTQSKSKIKKQVQQMPQKLKVEASIQFQVFTKFIGQASQTDKSIKNDIAVVRSQSPFDKLKNFFFGNQNQEEKNKAVQSPKKAVKPQVKQQKRQSKQKPKNRAVKQQQKQQIEFQFQQEELPKKPNPKHRNSSNDNVSKPSQRQKAKRRRQLQKQKDVEEESVQSSKRQPRTKQKGSTRRRTPSPQVSEEVEFQQQQKPKARRQQKQINKTSSKVTKNNQESDDTNKTAKSKNIVEPKQRDTLTQYQQKNRKLSNYNKSQQPSSRNQNNQNHQFYFDDPSSFPAHLKPNYKKDKNNNAKIQDVSSPQIVKKTKQAEQKNKTDRQIQKNSNQPDEQDQFLEEAPYKNCLSVPSPNRKVKENSIPISSKQLQKQIQKKKKQQRGSNKDANEIPSIPKNNDKTKVQKLKQPKEGKIAQNPSNKDSKTQKQEELSSSQVKQIFTSFKQPKRQEKPVFINARKQNQNDSNIFMKEQLQKKSKELAQMKARVQSLQSIQKRLKQEQQLRQKAEKTVLQQKQLNKRLQKELQRVKQQNNNLRSQQDSQSSSIFRATQDHFMHNSVDNDTQQQNKRLQREKNELIVNMTKQKQKHAKEIKNLKEQLQKQRLKFKQFENTSKIDLKKLKDDNLKLGGNVEIMKDKNKQKIKENETLLAQNKTLNGEVIQLKEKLASLKLKICEKLNQANQHGQSQLMQVLTELCEDM